MIIGGYTLQLLCDCKKCRDNPNGMERGEYTGETYQDCAKQARNHGWVLSRDKQACSAPGHGKYVKEDDYEEKKEPPYDDHYINM